MKKSYLFLFALLAFSQISRAQTTINVHAPEYDGSFGPYGPNSYNASPTALSSGAVVRACYLVPASELTRLALTNSVITAVGFDIYRPSTVAAPGQFTVYLQNTSDVVYTKGATFSNILTGMTQHFAGAMTLPTGPQNATTTVGSNLSSTFTWTGGGIYVAFEWMSNSAPTTTVSTRYLSQSNPAGIDMGAYASVPFGQPAPTTLTLSSAFPSNVNINPQIRFTTTNIATNEVGVIDIRTPGFVSKMLTPQVPVTAILRNNSVNALTNVAVTLSVSGANTYNNTQTLAGPIPAGGTIAAIWNGFQPTNNGLNNMTITVAPDQFLMNNGAIWTQSVNCTDFSNSPPLTAAQYNTGDYGYGGQAILATPFTPPASCSLSAIKFAGASIPTGISQVCGVLTDNTGAIIAMTNTVNLNAGSGGTYQNLKFTPAEALTAGNQYYFGVAQLTGNTFPFATAGVLATTNLNLFFTIPITGGSIGGAQNHMGYIGIQSVLTYSNLVIESASASKNIVCKQDGPGTVTLSVVGGSSSYTWTPGNLQGTSVVVTPSISSSTGTGNVNYNVVGSDATTGCRSNAVVVTVSVQACTGLAANNADGYNVKVFPNPAVSGKSTISGLVGTNVISVYNTLGQVVLTETSNDETFSVDLSNQPSGNYLIKISNSNNETRTIKIVNQN